MKKRFLAAPLWFLTGWYIGSVVAWMLNLGLALPLITAITSTALVVGDPRRMIWTLDAGDRPPRADDLNATIRQPTSTLE